MSECILIVYSIGLGKLFSLKLALYLSRLPSALHFTVKTQLHPTMVLSIGTPTISQVSFFSRAFIFSLIANFQSGSPSASLILVNKNRLEILNKRFYVYLTIFYIIDILQKEYDLTPFQMAIRRIRHMKIWRVRCRIKFRINLIIWKIIPPILRLAS